MTQKREVPGIRPYNSPAGGWGALKATAKAVRDQMDVTEAPGLLLRTNKPTGFDCPGCAWPDKEHTSTFQFCENGAKAVTWEATNKRVTPEFFAEHTVSELLTWSDYELENSGRLTHPMVYDHASDTYRPIAWEDAFARIGEVMRSQPDPDMVEFYTSGRASNEAAFLFQIFAREYGTNNFPDCSNMCHEATSVGLPQSIGIGKGTVSLDDFDECDLIISMGHNPGTNHPRMMGTLHECSRRGVPIIVFNPLKERALERFADPQDPIEMGTFGSTRIASSYYQVKIGGDAAALKGIMKAVLALAETSEDVLDHAFIAEHTNGFDALVADINQTEWTDIERVSGLARADLERVADAYVKSKATIVAYGMGITQHAKGTANVQQIANLLLLRGNFGKPGAGICPLRGHSNVQGNRTVGITEKPTPALIEGIERAFGFTSPAHHGHDAVAAMQAMAEGRSKVLLCLGGNFSIALPDPELCAQAMRKLDLAVHMNTKLNRSNLLIGKESFLFPVLGRTEQDVQATGAQSVTIEDSMSMVHASRGRLKPASDQLRSEPAIVAAMAQATLPNSKVAWMELITDYDLIRDKIEIVYPDFADYNERIRVPGGFRLPLGPTERIWKTPSGKAEFKLFDGLNEDISLLDGTILKLATIRSHDQYNTTIYGLDDRYRGVFGRRDVLFMNDRDLKAKGLEHGDLVEIETALPSGGKRLLKLTAISYDISEGSVAAYYPEANCLIPIDYQDKESGTPSYKSVPVRVSKAA
ncbi:MULTISPECIES: FdhF/YdeP family oxidoreductase [Rhizobium]|uniref:FdhF/YdeP family oxidoreductase n=1 Tax=Rhizobium tropici TaxID=398 RepID=A0A6P1C766_RHITR|nr:MULTISPECIES: FdhF/YdeP family oxidoreductase [Rhizobium]AGB74471.1 oxidoreductase alpha (molybdopterin) subunit [Rhizobium tropici CIAT 899]MBB4242792.1 molybdopterin-dependent oxidoreductase alpha subunit [Rhizobium tropici]MBB5594303.1 molybdopterin-dependent oxidoreductase alpha subunit [Rhizobium tropici]MBB6493117.1 molybdopterin-dependent oxidoreductase alpha subunit [Rhizobium tropici]NEV10774.1 FdhF/YdeP family oxidoreductase [Rhizobium tropici]